MLIGYLRPHGGDEAGHAAQRRALAEAGCEQIIEEQPDADDSNKQPELHALLARLRAGDVVVVPQLDSLGLSPADLVRRVQRLTAAGAGLRSLGEAIEASAPRGGAAVAAVGSVSARASTGRTRQARRGNPAAHRRVTAKTLERASGGNRCHGVVGSRQRSRHGPALQG